MRKAVFALLCTSAATCCVGFAVTAYAAGMSSSSGPSAEILASLPALAGSPAQLTAAERLSLNNLIPPEGVVAAGITGGTFDATRAVDVGQNEPMYILPGSSGTCLVVGNAGTCGDPLAKEQLGVLRIDTKDGVVTGSGVTSAAVSSIVETVDGTSAEIPVHNGVYVITRASGLHIRLNSSSPPHITAVPHA